MSQSADSCHWDRYPSGGIGRSVMRFAKRKSAPLKAEPTLAPVVRDRRMVSGMRVLCRCALELPKLDPFSAYKASRQGYMVLNVRGGSLYLAQPFSESAAKRVFPPGQVLPVKNFTLYPPGGPPIVIGELGARYLKVVEEPPCALVLRFVGLDEKQLELMNGLEAVCPPVLGNERVAIPMDELQRL